MHNNNLKFKIYCEAIRLFYALRFALCIRQKGAMLLPTILMMGAVVMMIGMAGLTVAVSFNRSNASIRASNGALEAARAGIADVERRIVRNPQWVPSVCVSLKDLPSYLLMVSNEATVNICVIKSNNNYAVQALGKARLKERRLNAVIAIDPTTHQVRTQSINEIQF